MTEAEKGERERKRNQRRQLKAIRGMMGRERFDLAKALAETPCPISYLQYFQDSPLARLEMGRINSLTTEILAAMFGDPSPRAQMAMMGSEMERGYNMYRGMNTLTASTIDSLCPHLGWGGAFLVKAIISGMEPGEPSFESTKVCIDSGSEVDIATPSTIMKREGKIIDMRDTPWPNLSIRTSSGSTTRLIAIARVKVNILGNIRIVYTCVIPETKAQEIGYNLLLGIPWLYEVRARIDIYQNSMTILNRESGEDEIIKNTNGPFSPPSFRVMFETCGIKNVPQSQEGSPSSSEEDEGEEVDAEGSSSKSDDLSNAKPRGHTKGYRYPDIVRPYGQDPLVPSRSTTLVMEDQGPGRKTSRVRYIEPRAYLELYAEDGPYSHLAGAIKDTDPQVEDNQGNKVSENDVMLVADHGGRWKPLGGGGEETPPTSDEEVGLVGSGF